MIEWYKNNLGLNTNQYGAVFEWRQGADTAKKGGVQILDTIERVEYGKFVHIMDIEGNKIEL